MTAAAAVSIALSGCSVSQVGPTAVNPVIPKPEVVAIGDSIMKGHGLTEPEAWPALLAARDGWSLDNLACNGAGFLTTGDHNDCDGTFSALVDTTLRLQPHTVIVEGSSNDFGEDDQALYQETVNELKELHRVLPDAHIVGLSTVWNDTAVPAQLAHVNEQVARAVRQVGGRYVNIGQPLAGHPDWMQSDDVHPTAAGQMAIYLAVKDALARAKIVVN